jgi:hypothetical protein
VKGAVEFVDDIEGFVRNFRRLDPCAPVMLGPPSPTHADRFGGVIRSYLQTLEPYPTHDDEDRSSDWMLSVDRSADSLCKAYADSDERPWRPWKYGDEIPSPARSLTFIGLASHFPLGVREALCCEMQGPWGVLCSVDRPGLAFQLLKIRLARGLRYQGILVLDAISKLMHRREASAETTTVPFSGAEFVRAVRESQASIALLQMHGRGSHAVTDDLVVCGSIGEQELNCSGNPLRQGCRSDPNGSHYCKMAKAHQSVVRFSSLQAPIVGLFSCANAAFPTELFPSNSSAVLSALQGFPAHVIGANHVWIAQGCQSTPTLDLIMKGTRLGEVVRTLNDLQKRFRADNPFILFGDPTARAPQRWIENSARPKDSDEQYELIKHERNEFAVTKDCGQGKSLPLLVGNTISLTPRSSSRVIAFGNATEEWQRYYDQLLEVTQRASHWDWLLLSMSKRYETMLASDATFQERVARLQSRRTGILSEAQKGLAVATRIKLSGVWDPLLPTCWELISAMLQLWDTELAQILQSNLFKDHSFEVFSQLAITTEALSNYRCSFCGSRMFEVAILYPTQPGRQFMRLLDCPLCSDQDAWYAQNVRQTIRMPNRVRAGTSMRVEVNADTGDPVLGPVRNAILVVTAFDRGSWCRQHDEMLVIKGPPIVLDVPVPTDASPRTHPVQFAILDRMAVHISRRFVAVVD